MTNIEVEQKFVVANLEPLQRKLFQLGAQFLDPIQQRDVYFAHPQRDFATTDEALRLRHTSAQSFITYKGPKLDLTTKTRREIDLALAGGQAGLDGFVELLEALGFRRAGEVRKIRRPGKLHWQDRSVQTALDQVDGIGNFAELEILAAPADVEEARACIQSLASELGLRESERRSYLELLRNRH